MLRAGMHALVEAVIAGAVVGLGEAVYVVASADVGSRALVGSAAALGAITAAIVVRILLALANIPATRRWAMAVREGQLSAILRALIVVGALFVFGVIAFEVGSHVHVAYRFIDAGPVGLLLAGVLGGAGIVIVGAAIAADRVAARTSRVVGRRARIISAIATCIALVVLPALVVHLAVPALSLPPVVVIASVVAAVLGARVLGIGAYFVSQAVAVALVVVAFVGVYLLATSPDSRGAIVSHGTLSLSVARTVWSIADRDHDGYASATVGGADCDDTDPKRNPAALDVPGNGIDENCTGGDAVPSPERLQAHPATGAPASIVLISIDALRADHLGSYGYPRKTSPNLDAFAATATRFDAAYTSCPSTRCAIPSLLTGRYYSTLKPSRDVPTLAKSLRDAGWQTAAITCCARFGLATNELAGFTLVDGTADSIRMSRAGQSNADVVIDTALEWLQGRDTQKPYLLWIHLYEPHFPYSAPSGPDFGDRDIDRYDTEIAYADAQLARLFARLDPSVIVAVTADHGDEFGEHGIRFHARSLYNQVVRVPLLVRAPGGKGRVVDTPVSLADVMPTLLDLAGVTSPAGLNGLSLAPVIRGEPAKPRPILIELLPDAQIKRDMAAVISAPWKAVWDREANAWSLYNLGDRDDRANRAGDPALPSLQKLLLETLDRETSPVLLQ
jgi:hypothetical protein